MIVPNANLAKWLQLTLAMKNSIFMNIGFQYLEAGLWEMLAALDRGENKPDMLDNDQLKILLLHILQNLDRSDADFLPITRYLFGEDDVERPDDAARLWQLAEKIAHLFKEYEFHRTDTPNRHDPQVGGSDHCNRGYGTVSTTVVCPAENFKR